MSERLVIIGGVAAGMSAAAKARRTNPGLDVVVYERGAFVSYGACGMPYWLGGEIHDYRSLIVRSPAQMAKQGVQVHLHHTATAVDPERHSVTVRDEKAETTFADRYDHLVIATGARAALPPLPGIELPGVFGLRSLESGLAIRDYLQGQMPRRVAIVGGGYIGVEMAEAFRRLGLETVLIVRSGQVMRTAFDEDVRAPIEAELVRNGVRLVKAVPVAITGDERVQGVVTDTGVYPADLVLLGVGAQPNVELAHSAGVALGRSGAIATDASMRTNLPDVYAAGDCTEALHLVTGRPVYLPLGSTANKQGRVAGANAAGGRETFGGIVGTMIVRVFDLAAARTGLTAAQARSDGRKVQETLIQAKDVSHYFPGAVDMHVKLVVDADSRRLLGAQIVGRPETAKRIDVLATALHSRLTVAELQGLDLGYAPPFAPVWDPILVAANVAAG